MSDPLSERAFRAVSIASALSAAARGQLDALDENDRIGVKSVLEALDRSAERVEKLLSEGSGDAEILSSAVEELEKRLGEILTEPEPEAGTQKKTSYKKSIAKQGAKKRTLKSEYGTKLSFLKALEDLPRMACSLLG